MEGIIMSLPVSNNMSHTCSPHWTYTDVCQLQHPFDQLADYPRPALPDLSPSYSYALSLTHHVAWLISSVANVGNAYQGLRGTTTCGQYTKWKNMSDQRFGQGRRRRLREGLQKMQFWIIFGSASSNGGSATMSLPTDRDNGGTFVFWVLRDDHLTNTFWSLTGAFWVQSLDFLLGITHN